MASTELSIYLNDHRAGAEGAEALARRCAGSNADNEIGDYLIGTFLPELREDRTLLESVRGRLGVRPNPVKQVAARLAELAGRAKLNGSLTGPTLLAPVIELEALIAGVMAKRQLWRALAGRAGGDPHAFVEPIERADRQLERLQDLHTRATDRAFETDRIEPPAEAD